jgi:phosphoribosylamine-glycine ligase
VHAGYPLTIEGWFNGNQFIVSLLAYIYDRLMVENIGPRVESMGAVIFGKFKKGRLYNEILKAMELPLRQVNYRGPVSIDCICNEHEFYAKKIHAYSRPAITNALCESTKEPISNILFSLVTGEQLRSINLDDWTISVTLSLPPWPYKNTLSYETVHLKGINNDNKKHIWLADACYKDGEYYCRRNSGYIGSVAARGKTIREARRRAYRTISFLEIPDLQYRVDIGKDATLMFDDLAKWGWL